MAIDKDNISNCCWSVGAVICEPERFVNMWNEALHIAKRLL